MCAAFELGEPSCIPLGIDGTLDTVEELGGKSQPILRRQTQRVLENSWGRMIAHAVDFSVGSGTKPRSQQASARDPRCETSVGRKPWAPGGTRLTCP
jgi:hypothetical protein